MGLKGIHGCSFVPKRSKIGQEMAKLWPFSHWEVGWFHWVQMAVQKPIWTTLLMLPINSLIHCSHPKLNFHGVQAEWCTSWCPWTCPWCRWLSRVHWQLPSTCVVTPDIFCFIDFVLKERFPEVPFAVTRKNWRHPTFSIHPKNDWRHPTFYSANSQIIVLKVYLHRKKYSVSNFTVSHLQCK